MAGFLQQAGNWGENFLKTDLNAGTSLLGGIVGNPNLIPKSQVDQSWQGANNSIDNIAGTVGKVGAQIAGNVIAPGIGGAAVGALQMGVGAATQNVNKPTATQQPVSPSQLYGIPSGQSTPTQQFWRGGRVGYANGGRIGYFLGSNGTPFNPNASGTLADTSGNMFNTPGDNTSQTGVFGNPDVTGGANTPNGQTGGGNAGQIAAIGSGLLGLGEAGVGLTGLHQLQKTAMPQYLASAQLNSAYQRAQQMSTMGYTPQEIAAFHTNLATSNNTAFANAENASGGNQSQAVNAALQGNNIGALNQFAVSDAQLKRQNQQYADSFAGQYQNLANENTQTALQRRQQQEQAYGGALKAGLTNLGNTANLSQALGSAGTLASAALS